MHVFVQENPMAMLIFPLLEDIAEPLKSIDDSLKTLVKLEEQGKKWNYIMAILAIVAIIVALLR